MTRMADPKKLRQEEEESSDEECIVEDMGDEGEEQEDDDEEMDVNEQVQVDFEGFSISDNDFHGIRQMLQQLFLKDNIDISEISNILIGQNFIGTLLKQSEFDEDSSNDSDDIDQVFGVTSCISVNGMHQPNEAISQLLKLLVTNCENYSTNDKDKKNIIKMLESKKEDSCLGWIINERFINIPPQVSLPMFEKLQLEIGEAISGKHKNCYEFTHYIMICKTYCLPQTEGKKFNPQNLEFINSEEELFYDESSASFTYPQVGAGALLSGKWEEDTPEMQPCRTVVLLSKDEILNVMSKLKPLLSVAQ